MKRGSAVSILLATLAACSRAGTTSDAVESAAARAEHRGKVVVTGSEPATTVQLVSGGGSVQLVGSLEPELRRLAGAELLVQGSLQGRSPVRRLEVQDYEITEIDGEVPSTGVIQARDGDLWLAGKDTIKLVGAAEDFRAGVGAKVWIIGPRSGRSLTVQSYGVIRE